MPITSLSGRTSSSDSSSSTTCSTPKCAEIAKSILADVDLNVDPCSDFYQYTCGSWLAKATIPDDRTSTGALSSIDDKNTQALRSILEGTYDDVYKSLISSDDGFHRQDQEAADKRNFDVMQKFYNVCMDQDKINALGPTPLYKDLSRMQNEYFPVQDETRVFSNETTESISKTMARFVWRFHTSLASIYVESDDKNVDANVVMVDQTELGLPSKEYYEKPEAIAAYKAGLKDILQKTIGTSYSTGTEDAAFRDSESQKNGAKRWSDEKIAAAVDRFVDFESKLANISLKLDEMLDPVKLYNPVKLSEFQAQNPLIDWALILKMLVPGSSTNLIKPDLTIINRAPPYFERFNELLSSGTVTEQTLQEYFIISLVTGSTSSLDSASREAARKMDGAISSGTSAENPRWEQCTWSTSNSLSNYVGRFYTLKMFGSETERKMAEDFVTNVHQAWLDRIPQLEWLDDQTKAKAIEKINLIAHKVGYSIISPDLRQPISIEEYYRGFSVNDTSYYDTKDNFSAWFRNKYYGKIGQKVDTDKWEISPQTVNAYYMSSGNQIVFPAGILQAPLYDAASPEYLNYGAMGMVVGHELTHAFDSSGRKFDGHGLLTDWWTQETSTKFEEKTQCFVDQYAKFTVAGTGNTTLNVNGKLTLAENLADNGGASAALHAYRKLDKQEQRLPGLENLSPEALFYVNMGRTWCSKAREESLQDNIYTDPHSPNGARVNGIIQNSKDFAQIFNCPAGSPMNPQNKCDMW